MLSFMTVTVVLTLCSSHRIWRNWVVWWHTSLCWSMWVQTPNSYMSALCVCVCVCVHRQCLRHTHLPIAFPGSTMYLSVCCVAWWDSAERKLHRSAPAHCSGPRGPHTQARAGESRSRRGKRERARVDLREGRRVVQRGKKSSKQHMGADGEQTAQIMAPSSGVEEEEDGGSKEGEINGKKEWEWRCA